jgi:ATP-dependent DNA helicase RecG
MRRVHESLPFPLTGAQHRAIAEIAADLAAPRPMNRLLHGDVGSGKTLVALSAMLLCVESGQQAALMAPTQILAEQHYLNFRRLLEPLGLSVALRTGARREEAEPLPLFAAGAAEIPQNSLSSPQILIGTHALLYEKAGVEDLGLAVIDEQHKFGVMQRARLRNQGAAPDVLVMTATPIPRTLTMTLYGDLDVSTLDEMPRNRGKIVTAVRDPAKLPDAVKFLREQLAGGRQAYIVYPLIDESEKLEAKAAATEFAKWREMLAPFSCELLHGRIPPDEKEATMQRFRRGETQALIATTVIEVGIDVPNATLMLIENAERFGLAQLHQLRGRIGRGEHKSYCILLSASDDAVSLEKLRTLERTSDGFEIAEADLRLRGPGDILGTAQSGLPPLKIGDPVADHELMRLARNAAFLIFERDPKLERPEHQRYCRLLADTQRLLLAQVS